MIRHVLTRAAFPALLASLPACAITLPSAPQTAAATLTAYDGDECHATQRGTKEISDQILVRVCGGTFHQTLAPSHAAASIAVEDRHRRMDDRRIDDVAVALLVIDATRAGAPVTTGLGAFYAEALLDRARLTRAVAAVPVSEGARAAFVDRAFAARDQLLTAAAALDPRRKALYLDVPRKVLEARKAYRAANATHYAELDRLEARAASVRAGRQAPDDLVTALEDLRATYLAACKSDECRFDPLPVELTRELVLLHLAANDALRARAENAMLLEKSAGRHLFPVEIGEALYRATKEEKHAYESYQRAKSNGLDEATLAQRFGSPPPLHIDAQDGFLAPDTLPDLSAVLERAEITAQSGIVKSVVDARKTDPQGRPLVRISFRDVVTASDVMNCYGTGRVAGVRFDSSHHASLEYETKCDVVGSETHVEKIAPVLVPAREAQRIRPDEHLSVLLASGDAREGVVVRSLAKGAPPRDRDKPVPTPVLQVRGQRIGAR